MESNLQEGCHEKQEGKGQRWDCGQETAEGGVQKRCCHVEIWLTLTTTGCESLNYENYYFIFSYWMDVLVAPDLTWPPLGLWSSNRGTVCWRSSSQIEDWLLYWFCWTLVPIGASYSRDRTGSDQLHQINYRFFFMEQLSCDAPHGSGLGPVLLRKHYRGELKNPKCVCSAPLSAQSLFFIHLSL